MDVQWLKLSSSLNKGFVIINQYEETKFEQFLRRILAKYKLQDTEIFTEDERQKLEKIFNVDEDNLLLSIKTILYLFKRMLKFIFMPNNLKINLTNIGLNNEKAEVIVKVWSSETRTTLNDMNSESIDGCEDTLNFSWKLNAELSSDYHKKCKIPKSYISLLGGKTDTEIELTHSELYSVFLQFESIQSELDNLF
ncbi:COMM domain-containing protein 10-like [Aphomia sociella]